MTQKQAAQMLDTFLASIMSGLDFKRFTTLRYDRHVKECIAQISFPCRVDPRGFVAFNCAIGLRFESVARWLDNDPAERVATLGTPIQFLREDRSFVEWKFTGAPELEGLRDAISSDLKNLAVPFIERYSTLNDVRNVVAMPNPPRWLCVGPDDRVRILAVIQLIQGDKAGAIKTLDDALAERRTGLPKHRIGIEYLRRQLAQVS